MQEELWDKEYRDSKLLTKENKPQSDVVRFVKWLKLNGYDLIHKKILDLGSGTGRNSFYFAELGASVTGIEISKTAIDIGIKKATESGLIIKYIKQSIGEKLPFDDDSFDILLDVTSSNSLTEKERGVFLSEARRVLKNGGVFFTKALCKDGDSNAKELLKKFPGKERDTYVLPKVGVCERVWAKEDFVETYSKYFQVSNIEKKTSYTRMNDRVYKRNFWITYMNIYKP